MGGGPIPLGAASDGTAAGVSLRVGDAAAERVEIAVAQAKPDLRARLLLREAIPGDALHVGQSDDRGRLSGGAGGSAVNVNASSSGLVSRQ